MESKRELQANSAWYLLFILMRLDITERYFPMSDVYLYMNNRPEMGYTLDEKTQSITMLLDLLEKLDIKSAGAEYMDNTYPVNNTMDGYIDPFLNRMTT